MTWVILLRGVDLPETEVVDLRSAIQTTCDQFGVHPETVTLDEALFDRTTKPHLPPFSETRPHGAEHTYSRGYQGHASSRHTQ